MASKLSKAHVHNIFCVNSFLAVDVGQHIPFWVCKFCSFVENIRCDCCVPLLSGIFFRESPRKDIRNFLGVVEKFLMSKSVFSFFLR